MIAVFVWTFHDAFGAAVLALFLAFALFYWMLVGLEKLQMAEVAPGERRGGWAVSDDTAFAVVIMATFLAVGACNGAKIGHAWGRGTGICEERCRASGLGDGDWSPGKGCTCVTATSPPAVGAEKTK